MSDQREQLFESVKHEFLTVADSEALSALVDRAPFMLEPEFLAAAGRWLSEAEASDARDVAEGIRERLEVLRELTAQQVPAWRAALEGFVAARTADDLAALVRDTPLVSDQSFHRLIEGLISEAQQAGDHDDAAALRLRLEDLRQLLSDGAPGATLAGLLDQMRASALEAAPSSDAPELIQELERQALALLRHLGDQQQLMALIAQMPLVLENSFLERVEQAIAQSEASGDTGGAGQLRARLEGLRLIRAQVQITLPQTLEAFAGVRDGGELLALVQRAPFVLEESFIGAVERTIAELEAGGGRVEAEALRARLDALRQLRDQHQMTEQSPLLQAILNFLNAHDDDAARAIYSAQEELLDNDEAQEAIDSGFAGGDPESQQRIEERAALLRELRAHAPDPSG